MFGGLSNLVRVGVAFAAGYFVALLLRQDPPNGNGDAAEPAETPVTLTDPATGERVDFYEGASKGDDPAESLGTLVKGQYSMGDGAGEEQGQVHVFISDDPGRMGRFVDVDRDIRCGHTYFVRMFTTVGASAENCGGGAVVAAQFGAVKDAVLRQAFLVADKCRRLGCDPVMRFAALNRRCRAPVTPGGNWVLSVGYEVRVSCLHH
jgi:hypothetical protein